MIPSNFCLPQVCLCLPPQTIFLCYHLDDKIVPQFQHQQQLAAVAPVDETRIAPTTHSLHKWHSVTSVSKILYNMNIAGHCYGFWPIPDW